jgi:aspartyl-tRNA(Asn)/glutamyl-tRNA(Gln) amidotransferase subunit A
MNYPVAELGALLRARKISPVEVVASFLKRIEDANPQVNAFLTVTAEHARREARRAEEEIVKGAYRGPLHGIPYAVKDLIATKGIRTTNGSRATGNWIPDADAAVIARLNNAGAILLGKLNLLEFAMGSGQRGLNGPARNPWHLDYSPSGSSSGSGAALAASMVPLTLGSDTGGSIRGPAKSCGVTGLKPTYDLIPRAGVTALSWTLDHVGPMARSVHDVALLLEAIGDNQTAFVPGSIKGLRVGVPTEHFFTHVRPETDAALRRALSVLTSLGVTVVDVKVENANLCGPVSAVILSAESAAVHEPELKTPELLEPLVLERLQAGSLHTAMDYIKALRVRTVLMEEMRRVFRTCDVLMLPAGNAAPLLSEETVLTDAPRNPPATPRPDVFNLANITGIPALVLPCGFTAGPPALPLGIQFCAAHNGESTLFRLGQAYQAVTDWHQRRPAAYP